MVKPNTPKFYTIKGYCVSKQAFGSGSFGHVSSAQVPQTGEQLAIKFIPDAQWDDAERNSLATLKHPNVLALREYFRLGNTHHLVTEYAAGGDLFDFLDGKPRIEEDVARGFFRQLVHAMAYVHAAGIVHRDLKLENIFLDQDKRKVMIGDWGFSTKWSLYQPLKERCGTLYYLAPEIVQNRTYLGPEVDTWSLGVLLYYLIVGRLPFDAGNDKDTERLICDCQPPLPSFLSASARDLISQILSPVDRRPNLQTLAAHPWITGQPFLTPYPLQYLAAAAMTSSRKRGRRSSSERTTDLSNDFVSAELLLAEHDCSPISPSSSTNSLSASPSSDDIFINSDYEFDIDMLAKRQCHRSPSAELSLADELSFSSSTSSSLFAYSPDDSFFSL